MNGLPIGAAAVAAAAPLAPTGQQNPSAIAERTTRAAPESRTSRATRP